MKSRSGAVGRVISLQCLRTWSLASMIGLPMATEAQEIAWMREDWSSTCTALAFKFPASLVPIQDDAAATGGLSWYSFDKRLEFMFEEKATYFETYEMNRASFLKSVSCENAQPELLSEPGDVGDQAASPAAEPTRLRCASASNKVNDSDKMPGGGVCSRVFVIALDTMPRDRSRFVSQFSLCGPAKDLTLITDTMKQVFDSISLTYNGCCQRDPNYNGCR